ncbi:gamma-glutamylcyclotransferase [Paenirhodobacter populi]|uniref:ADP-ribose pyrophosphatase n=1 Tax=Paenirhodobacter populi TaxID=2306993 RepID=A0A443JV89_9RHOB|nr:gamma-glutamylcyclotransferase [Sinirhodobacter populi]RWR24440.1 NUDIX domain-containing protein [Sinirhodobacter populi]
MDRLHFFYGTLCHAPLLAEVLGHEAETETATLAGYATRNAQDDHGHALTFPVLVPAEGGQVRGQVLRLSPGDEARLDFYEAGYQRVERTVTLADGREVAAQVYLPEPGHMAPDGAWDFAAWERKWGRIVPLAAREYMALRGVVPQADAVTRYPMILVRAASRLRAAVPHPDGLRRTPEPGDVVVDSMHTGYAHFFAVEDYVLRYRTFAGKMSRPLPRAAFVSGDATVVLPYDPVLDRVLLVEQFRAGPFARGDANPWSLEPVAGRVDPGETPAEAALREAGEEAGLSISRLLEAPHFYPSPGAKTEYLYCFVGLADLSDGSARPGGLPEEGEDIRPHLIPFARLMEMIERGEADNGPLLVLALWLERLRPGLRAEVGLHAPGSRDGG